MSAKALSSLALNTARVGALTISLGDLRVPGVTFWSPMGILEALGGFWDPWALFWHSPGVILASKGFGGPLGVNFGDPEAHLGVPEGYIGVLGPFWVPKWHFGST